MIFVKTINGEWVNAAHVKRFFVEGLHIQAETMDNDEMTIAEEFNTFAEAQKWLDELVAEIEADK